MNNAGPKSSEFRKMQKQPKKVCQYNLEGEFIAIYDSLAEAAKAIDGCTSGICRVVKGEKKSVKGYM